MAKKYEVHSTTPYLSGTVATASANYAYRGYGDPKLIRYDKDFNKRDGGYTFSTSGGAFIREIFATKTEGEVFVVYRDSAGMNGLWRTNDYGDTFTQVASLGDNGGAQIIDVWALQNAFCEITISGVKTYLIGEYNVNSSRTPGGKNDKVRILRSIDSGVTWSTMVEFNTNGHQVRHCHAIVPDQDNNIVYFCFGDTDSESGIIAWDTSSGVWVNNPSYSQLGATSGFHVVYGQQRYRTVGVVVSENYIHWMADCINVGECGIWRAHKDISGVTRSNYDVETIGNHEGWAGLLTSSGDILFTDDAMAVASDRQTRIWCSSDEGSTYQIVGLFTQTDGVVAYLKLSELDGNIFLGSIGAAVSQASTAIITKVGESYSEEFAPIFHPVYYVGPLGSSAFSGKSPLSAKSKISDLLSSGVVPYGSRIIHLDGKTSVSSCQVSLKAESSGMVYLEGSGASKSHIEGDSTNTAYVIYFGTHNNVNYLVKDITIDTLPPRAGSKTTIYAGSSGATGVTLFARDAVIGTDSGAVNSDTIYLYNTINAKRTTLKAVPGKYVISSQKNNCVYDIRSSIVIGGSFQFYIDHSGVSQTLLGCVFDKYTSYCVRYNTTNLPLIKGCIFLGGAGTAAIRDSGALAETDSNIDYNLTLSVSNGYSNIANNGGSHSLSTTDPKFVDRVGGNYRLLPASQCIGAGANVGLTSDMDGNAIPGPCGYSIGPYEYMSQVDSGYSPWSLLGAMPALTVGTGAGTVSSVKVQ